MLALLLLVMVYAALAARVWRGPVPERALQLYPLWGILAVTLLLRLLLWGNTFGAAGLVGGWMLDAGFVAAVAASALLLWMPRRRPRARWPLLAVPPLQLSSASLALMLGGVYADETGGSGLSLAGADWGIWLGVILLGGLTLWALAAEPFPAEV